MLISGLTFLCLWRCVKVSSHTAIHVDALNDVPPYLGLYFVKMPHKHSFQNRVRQFFDSLNKKGKTYNARRDLWRPLQVIQIHFWFDEANEQLFVKFVIFIIITFFIALSVHCKKVEVLNFKSVLRMWNNISTPLLTHLISLGHLLVIVRSFTELYFNSSDMGEEVTYNLQSLVASRARLGVQTIGLTPLVHG